MAISVSTDSGSGDQKAETASRNQTSGVDINLKEKITDWDRQIEIDNLANQLPANSFSNKGSIRWFNSSYSGSDIEVIAHMYDNANWKSKKLKELNEKLEISQTIVNGCNSLIEGGLATLSGEASSELDYNTKRDAFIAAAKIQIGTPGRDQAANILIARIYSHGGGFTYLGLAKMQRRAERLRQEHKPLIQDYTTRQDNIKQLEDAGSSNTVTLATLQTISVQSYRDKPPVRALGHTYVKSYGRGQRTIGGSCIFTTFNEHALSYLIRELGDSSHYNPGERDIDLTTLLPDQLPPLDLTIRFANEYGSLSDRRLYGVEFFSDGDVYSIEDLISENTMNFVCKDADVMTSRGRIRLSRLQRGMFNDKDDKDLTGSSLLFDNQAYYEYLDKLKVRRRLTNR